MDRPRPIASLRACETPRKLIFALLMALSVVVCVAGRAVAQEARPETRPSETHESAPALHDGAAAGEEAHEEAHEEGLLPVVARIVNFAILAGTLVYLLRTPIRTYLADRGSQIRADLVNAAEMKVTAAREIEEIDQKLRALPGELEALQKQGAREIAAEEERIRSAADAERTRLLEQARREIDLQVKVAERDLVTHAADLAVGVATARIKKDMTDDDQQRLVDRYVQQLKD